MDMQVCSWISSGYPSNSSLLSQAGQSYFAFTANTAQRSLLLREIEVLQEKQVIPEAQLHHAAFYTSMSLVLKPNGTYMPILNVSDLNVYIHCLHFKVERVQSVHMAICLLDVFYHSSAPTINYGAP